MSAFKVANNGGDDWLICWTGQDDQGNHFNVTTNQIPASQLSNYTQGAEGDAQLIATLLNGHYSGRDTAKHKALQTCIMFLTNVNAVHSKDFQEELVKNLKEADLKEFADAVAAGGAASLFDLMEDE